MNFFHTAVVVVHEQKVRFELPLLRVLPARIGCVPLGQASWVLPRRLWKARRLALALLAEAVVKVQPFGPCSVVGVELRVRPLVRRCRVERLSPLSSQAVALPILGHGRQRRVGAPYVCQEIVVLRLEREPPVE